ncbi:FecR family protein [Variovorax atrisoli]|uniref:FecR family protein n=1 Tax=Variovorax atrisoli TaxID=3394203 RepID=UPI001F0CBAD5|nr:FecR domain-containing protein [Variovorax sp. 369]
MNGGSMAVGAPPRERLIERALALIVEGEIATGEAAGRARALLDQWRSKSAEHAAAVQEAHERWDALGGMASDLRAHFDEPEAALMANAAAAATTSTHRQQRRKMLLSVAAFLGTGLVAGRGVQWYWQQPVFRAAYETRTAQMLKVTLTDGRGDASGSQLDLAPQSAIDVTLYRQRRTVDMAHGEVRFEVARDTTRPFHVRTRGASIEVVGTAFTVRDRGGPLTVGVENGHVRVRVSPRDGATGADAEVIDLRMGDLLEIQDGHAAAVRQTDTAALSAWRSGWLVFENTPLGDALAAVNSYRARPIVSTNSRIDAMRLSGRFRTNDSDGLVAVLPTILPLATEPRPDGSVALRVR